MLAAYVIALIALTKYICSNLLFFFPHSSFDFDITGSQNHGERG